MEASLLSNRKALRGPIFLTFTPSHHMLRRGSLAQEPAAFRALHAHGGAFSGAQDASQPKAGNDGKDIVSSVASNVLVSMFKPAPGVTQRVALVAASGRRWCAVAESPDRGRPWHADGTPAIPPESDAAPR